MAESVKLLNPARRVLNPEPRALCPMAYMVRREDVEKVRAQYAGDVAVACYINSTAEIKTWSDVCVTSSNAVKVISQLPERNVLFIPDMNLGRYVAEPAAPEERDPEPRLLPHAPAHHPAGGGAPGA